MHCRLTPCWWMTRRGPRASAKTTRRVGEPTVGAVAVDVVDEVVAEAVRNAAQCCLRRVAYAHARPVYTDFVLL